ncbi:glycosyl hydrolase [Chromatiaceae bacterium AAb-1]|nr:glycosyl hydrolase [Chromatiaceae bacterium AAb-1]
MIKKLTKLSDFMLLGTLCFAVMTTGIQSAYAAVQQVGNGSIANQPNPLGYKCTEDYGFWVHNAGVVEPGISGCDPVHGPIGTPTPLLPQLTGPAAAVPTATHRWWGSVAFYGEMAVNNPDRAGYITPDPITARITERGFRMLGIPAGLRYQQGNSYIYPIPDPFSEVFDGIAIANSQYSQLQAYLYNYSDGSVTVEWQNNSTAVMRATFVHGSPYTFIDVLQGQLLLKTKAGDGPEKGVYHQQDNRLGLWTDVAGNRNTYLVVGEGPTSYSQVASDHITAANSSGRFTIALLPVSTALPDTGMINDFASYALNRVDQVQIDYSVDSVTQAVSVSHNYRFQGQPVQTLTGLMPLQWKNLTAPVSANYQIRSARGVVKFAPLNQFTYKLPFVGVLPSLPALTGSYDVATLTQLIRDFIAQGPAAWNDKTDTYWTGKNYGKVAELAALAHQHGLVSEHAQLHSWLKAELEDWFTAETNGVLAVTRYFSYDDQWSTVLGYDESFGAQQQLNDHHFHYGYFVRAAAEICRTEKSWCASDAWGGMVELLIRDYAAQRNDPLFPYSRNFDPANGFSWASGHANFVLGNNNESTSEAANAYGAIVLYGLITGNQQLTNHGIYLHASSAASYWEYWNNLDRYRGLSAERDNFPAEYDKITTSIIWGNGMVFSTWFSGAYAHILGIQGLPLNPLVMHIGQHADYLADYVSLGMNESSNGKPSGLPNDHWRDVWWNIWAMTDAQAAINDFNTLNFNYDVEAGETVAHTYHWIHAFNTLGHLRSGAGGITADYPAALVFEKNGVLTYVAYNYSNAARQVNFSDGTLLNVNANSFAVSQDGDTTVPPEPEEPEQPEPPQCEQICAVSLNATTLRVTANAGGIADIHYTVNNGVQLNLRMDYVNGQHRYDIGNLSPGDVVRYFLTVIDGPAYDTPWYELTFQP